MASTHTIRETRRNSSFSGADSRRALPFLPQNLAHLLQDFRRDVEYWYVKITLIRGSLQRTNHKLDGCLQRVRCSFTELRRRLRRWMPLPCASLHRRNRQVDGRHECTGYKEPGVFRRRFARWSRTFDARGVQCVRGALSGHQSCACPTSTCTSR